MVLLKYFFFLILDAQQQQCVVYSSLCFLKCPSTKLKQMRWHSARTNLNSAMTKPFAPRRWQVLAMLNFAELVCSPSPHLLLISRRQGKRSRRCQKPSNKSHCLQRKRGECFCTNNNSASSLSCNYLLLQIICWFLSFCFLLRKHLSWKT